MTKAHAGLSRSSPGAVVTGGASGIGLAVVSALLDQGFSVVAADSNEAALADCHADFVTGGLGDRVVPMRCDVRVESDVEAAVARAEASFGAVHCMINNAGVGGAFGSISDILSEDWDYTYAVLVRGVFYGIKHASRAMRRRGRGGSIVNVSSVAGLSGFGGASAYASAKAAVNNLTRAVATELAPYRIRVNAVCPGVIRTPLLGDRLPEEPPDAQPWPEWGRPEDVASVVAFLAGVESGFVTGESVVVDGGLVAAGPGPELDRFLGVDQLVRGRFGVSRGNSGEPSSVHRVVREPAGTE